MRPIRPAAVLAVVLLSACAGTVQHRASDVPPVADFRISAHSAPDDLLTAGLGLDGLRSPTPPAFADPARPTPEELRRRALWTNWRGIADLSPTGGYGTLYGSVQAVPGREYHALVRLDGARQPHRVLVQVPDEFDIGQRCVVVTASSGSRGIYGAIAVAGAWGLPRGCAVAYTDKGAGTGYFDLASGTGVKLDGTRGARGEALEFEPPGAPGVEAIAVKHAHSQDNPEADWGRHVRQVAEVALRALDRAFEAEAPFTHANTRVIAVSLSNGAGAVLRAAELEGDWLDGAVAAAPNIYPGEGGRPLYDYATEAALFMPCALLAGAFDEVDLARPGGVRPPVWSARCAALAASGLVPGASETAQAEQAYQRLKAAGWSDAALIAGTLSASFDLWRAVAVTYASAYGRYGAGDTLCGYRFAALDPAGTPRVATDAERAAWWSDASGIPPGAGVSIVGTRASGPDPALPGLRCLREQWTGDGEDAAKVQAGVAQTRAALPRAGLPLIVIHGADDGLVPEAFSGGAYAHWAAANGRALSYWRVAHAQHFDAFLALPPLAARYVPLLPYAYRALDAMWAHLSDGTPLPASADIAATPRAAGAPLTADNLALP